MIYPRNLILDRKAKWKNVDYHSGEFAEVFAFGDKVDPDSMYDIEKSLQNPSVSQAKLTF